MLGRCVQQPAPSHTRKNSLKVGPGEFERQLEVLVLLILDPAETPDQPLRLSLTLLFEGAPVRHVDAVSRAAVPVNGHRSKRPVGLLPARGFHPRTG